MNYLAASERSKRAVHKNLLHDDMICTPIHGGLFDCVDAIRSVQSGAVRSVVDFKVYGFRLGPASFANRPLTSRFRPGRSR